MWITFHLAFIPLDYCNPLLNLSASSIPPSPDEFYFYLHDFVVIVWIWVLLRLPEFNDNHCDLFTIRTIPLGPGGLLSGTQVKTIAAFPTESISNRGRSSAKKKAPKLPRPWLIVEAQSCLGLLQAAQLSQSWLHWLRHAKNPAFHSPSPGATFFQILHSSCPLSGCFLSLVKDGINIQGWAVNSHSLALWAAESLQSPSFQRRSLIEAMGGICL